MGEKFTYELHILKRRLTILECMVPGFKSVYTEHTGTKRRQVLPS